MVVQVIKRPMLTKLLILLSTKFILSRVVTCLFYKYIKSLVTFFPCLSSTYLIITCLICLAAESLASAGSPAADEKLFENVGTIQADGSEDDMNLLVYPYERLTVNSKDPETSIDITKREVNPFLRIQIPEYTVNMLKLHGRIHCHRMIWLSHSVHLMNSKFLTVY